MHGVCKLCQKETQLELSHFIPKFIGKWAKKTSITGYFREGNQVSKRQQDIAKEYWLCGSCEDLFSTWERLFSLKIFYPYIKDTSLVSSYGSWLSKFTASLSWRTLTYICSKNNDVAHSKEYLDSLVKVERGLADFLLGKVSNLNEFEQHIYPLDVIESTSFENLPTNINRYFLRTIAMDIVGNSQGTYIYTKLPSFIVIGVIKSKQSKEMRSSRVAISGGTIYPRQYVFPDGFDGYILDAANKVLDVYEKIPEEQLAKIDKYVIDNQDKVVKSKLFEAIVHDYERFGRKSLR
ncbi:hypothetical protein [Vibrio ziniensis]|uniref:HNH endonuclease n=1 Tax=Vibrio ziniensis TaxID=2711221 RepID=A0A6G7CN59_9VIBR|nr:hypothetical protein [Vibrio ziniensis]QIH43486.1 hypothetical protein G5S32_15930 [Vibrio ziniensis]